MPLIVFHFRVDRFSTTRRGKAFTVKRGEKNFPTKGSETLKGDCLKWRSGLLLANQRGYRNERNCTESFNLHGSARSLQWVRQRYLCLYDVILTTLVQAVVIVINFGLNLTQCVGPGWFPSNTATFCPLSAAHTCTRPSFDPTRYPAKFAWHKRNMVNMEEIR